MMRSRAKTRGALLLKIQVEAPVEPFVADEQDEHVLTDWLLHRENEQGGTEDGWCDDAD
jgi:hypothetical protein